MTISKVEEDYKNLVGEDGFEKALKSAEFLCRDIHDRELFFATLCNVYWRGLSDGVDKARSVVQGVFLANKRPH